MTASFMGKEWGGRGVCGLEKGVLAGERPERHFLLPVRGLKKTHCVEALLKLSRPGPS